jgi:hypothetical protein
MPATHMWPTIQQKRCFLCGQRRDPLLGKWVVTRLYKNRRRYFPWSQTRGYITGVCLLGPTVSRPFCLGVSPIRFLLLSDISGVVDVGRPLWREDGSVVYNCCWASPAQPFSGPSPAGLMTIFWCLRFETPPTWRARPSYLYPSGTGWPSYVPRHWVPFSSPPTNRRATVEVFKPASTREIGLL